MTLRQAKEILILYRPGTADSADPEFNEALAMAKRDQELGRWFQSHCAWQSAVRSKFRQIRVPEGLKEQILSERNLRLKSRLSEQVLRWAPAMAGLVLVCVLAGLWLMPPARNSFALFEDRMARMVLRQYPRMELQTSDLAQIQQHLAQQGVGAYTLPESLVKTQGTGCAVLHWHGRPVSMICFNSGQQAGGSTDPDLFLFIIDRSAVAHAPTSPSPQFAQLTRELSVASWGSGQKAYLLAGLGNQDYLRGILRQMR